MILAIKNRTENWTTANYLSKPEIVSRLLKKLTKSGNQDVNAKLELFWYGYRDYCHCNGITEKNFTSTALVERFYRLFPNLRKDVEKFSNENPKLLRLPQLYNYEINNAMATKLFHNIRGTEIDIVIETKAAIYIGEVKDTQAFGAKGDAALPHQLLRQYIMVKILLDELQSDLEVIPFVISGSVRTKNSGQVKLMQSLEILNKENVITWDMLLS